MRGVSEWAIGIRLMALVAALLASPAAIAQIQALERVIMPGPLTTDHAEYETDCSSCHARFSRGGQRTLCLDCHTEIAEDLQTQTGFHGLSADVGNESCAECHTEHEGRDADITGLDRDSFDHDLTDFPLAGSHADAACEDCHQAGQPFHEPDTQCFSCHLDDDQHHGNLGDDCGSCHRETEWSDAHFDHELETDYALTGAHDGIDCVSCHVDEQYVDTPTECVSCHLEDDEHEGKNGTECQECHTTGAWEDSTFDHFERSGFALTGGHAGIECDACHEGNKLEQEISSDCVSCHLEDDSHDGINGTECADCHQATEWLDVLFDHSRDTDFALNGAHAELKCADCHFEPVADALPETTCIGCHADDEPHEGQLGDDCASCHAEVAWKENVRFDHGLTIFPLLGKHAEVECEDCHATPAFHDASEECIECHRDDDAHENRLGPDCAACHSAVDWALWTFDHDVQTDFPLEGAHAGLACEGCHRRPAVDGIVTLSQRCVECHRTDDVHRGEFGDDCAACHSTESFGVLLDLP